MKEQELLTKVYQKCLWDYDKAVLTYQLDSYSTADRHQFVADWLEVNVEGQYHSIIDSAIHDYIWKRFK